MTSHYKEFVIIIGLLTLLISSCTKNEIDISNSSKVELPWPLVIEVGQSGLIGLTYNGKSIPANNAFWTIADTTIATINQEGRVTALWAGETIATATLINGKGSVQCKVTVFDNQFNYKFRLILKDKGASNFSIDRPNEYLSPKAIARRKNQNLSVVASDLPISPDYIQEIEEIGGLIVAKSKWLNTVTVHINDPAILNKYKQLQFIERAILVWKGKKSVNKINRDIAASRIIANEASNYSAVDSAYYGAAWDNIIINNGQILHEMGYKGAGIDIAVIDGGFSNIKNNPSLKNIKTLGTKSFIYENNGLNDIEHGVWVTSCMATNIPGYFVGTAPESNYWLLQTEDSSSEYPVEQDYWVAALEYADSVGVDIVNASLYYNFSDFSPYEYPWENLDGKTEMASRGANMAAAKGIFIVCCAGNNQTWVGTPGDSPNVLTVGSIQKSGEIDYFTSFGETVDGRLKPDVVALGGGATVIDFKGEVIKKSGTSYASPIICGLVACLWQAYPQLSNKELLDIIKRSAHKNNNPELPYGHGIPDMQKALQLSQ